MGVTVTTLEEGSGPSPQPGQTVIMGYTGWLKDTSQPDNKGTQFDSSYPRDEPGKEGFKTQIGVGRVIKGWDEGVPQMKLGGKARLDISSDYGYGPRGFPGAIPPNSDLIFDVHLLKIE
ncbi:peptidyl-prolyl cis-trans isomerase fkr-3 [Trichoderma gamsii]|uniref:peptidylprolyl isomerase n=1 Tax=Trichoderma gamsii TaxID=398673 RepID=A0A2P4ZS63_9HYPO|nr:peptidyl-prolyl cis-trans isomerase fkr-3 [Trichoderma gamsii]PON27142.1 peptidyl-prolyl cis-trans isomerase fkr-3 [Trichoderma gamsii]